MNFLALQNAVLIERFDPTVYRDRVKGWLNDANSKVRRRLKLPDAELRGPLVTVAGQPMYDVPAGTLRVLGVSYPVEAQRLEPLDLRALDVVEVGATGRPTGYVFTGTKLVFTPTPDAAYTLELDTISAAPKLVADSDVPALPEEYHDVLVTYAQSRGYRSEEDFELAAAFMNDYELELQRLAIDLQNPVDDGPKQVPGMWLDGFRG